MTAPNFRFDLFDPAFAEVLSNCRYINLPFEIPHIYDEVNHLLTLCGSVFVERNEEFIMLEKFKDCARNAKVVLDIAWEKINTGHWTDVDHNWRYAFTLGSLFKVLCLMLDKSANKFDIIKSCDIGLLMGAPLMQNILSKIAFKVSAMLIKEYDEIDYDMKAKRLKSVEPEDEDLKYVIFSSNDIDHIIFKDIYIKSSKPIKLIASVTKWPALSSSLWSVHYILNKARFRTVPIEIGSKYTDDSWTQKLMTVEEFVNVYIANQSKEVGYLAQHNLFDQIPELFEDISIPSYITDNYGDVDTDISVYFGPAGTVSPLHYDPKHNLLAQVIGKKYIRLYSKENTEYLYPRYNTWLSNTSQVDVDNPNLEAYPLFKNAAYQECILSPGDLLYIPPGCWHYVRSLSVSLSISFWWEIPD